MNILLFGRGGQVGWELQRSLSVLGSLTALDLADRSSDISRTLYLTENFYPPKSLQRPPACHSFNGLTSHLLAMNGAHWLRLRAKKPCLLSSSACITFSARSRL